jgi:hypothetical protein
MQDDTTITPLHQPGSILDPLTEIAREGARQMLAAALRAEAASFVAQFEDERLPDGRHRVVRHGTGPERLIQTGIGPIPVQRQKVRDRAVGVPTERRIRFTSNILPRWARRSKSLDALLPVLYLRGISTGDFQGEAPSATGSSERAEPDGAARDGRAEPVAWRDPAPHGGLAGGLRSLAAPRPLRTPLCLHLGRWGLPSGPDGADRRMHAGDHRCDT